MSFRAGSAGDRARGAAFMVAMRTREIACALGARRLTPAPTRPSTKSLLSAASDILATLFECADGHPWLPFWKSDCYLVREAFL